MQHVSALDGYRGLALLFVLLFHAELFPIGWVGVPLFFVLSSYLITTLQYEQRNAPARAYFSCFWERRARRLFPLYYFYIALLVIPVFFVSETPLLQLLSLSSFTFDFVAFFSKETAPYWGHFWSLSVEFQFYLLWPIVIYRVKNESSLRVLALSMILMGPAGRYLSHCIGDKVLFDISATNIFASPLFFIDAFGWGALIALSTGQIREAFKRRPLLLLLPGLAALSSLLAIYFHSATVKGSLVCGTAGLLLLAAIHGRSLRVFEWRWLQFLGKISYGAYVWHLCITNIAIHYWDCSRFSLSSGIRFLACIFPLTLLVSMLSYRFLERPFLRKKIPVPERVSAAAPASTV